MISVDEAFSRLISNLAPLRSERVKIGACMGRVLAGDVYAALACPPKDVSSMDGYAVRAQDTGKAPVTLRQIGRSQAGAGFAGSVQSGETVRIFTGAPMPGGADAVVIQENAVVTGETVEIRLPVRPGRYVRPRGLDMVKGDRIRTKGHRLTARDLGLLASANIAEADVYRRPRVGYLATGDELVMPGSVINGDQIINSNSIAMDACITAFGGTPVSLGIARDTADSLKQALATGADCDFLVTMGGASVGDFDLVRSVLDETGHGPDFHTVAMRPGKPLIFGCHEGTPLLGLPGNPVSASVTALLFLRPAIERLQGMPGEPVATTVVKLGEGLAENGERQDYIRSHLHVSANSDRIATPLGRQDSSMMSRLAQCNCLIVREPHASAAAAGDDVRVIELPRTAFAY